MTIAETLDQQDRIIKEQADIINRLSNALLQYMTLEEIEALVDECEKDD